MAVRIRMKKLGRKHRPYFRICAMDGRAPRDGRVLEELGTYDPTIPETDARAVFNRDRVDYWIGVGAQPSEKVAVLLKKYGTGGTHVSAQDAALDRLAQPTPIPDPGKPASLPKKAEAAPETTAASETSTTEDATAEAPTETSEEKSPAPEAPATEAPAAETPATEATAEEETKADTAAAPDEAESPESKPAE